MGITWVPLVRTDYVQPTATGSDFELQRLTQTVFSQEPHAKDCSLVGLIK
jgi:hypothetical protein